MKLIINRKTFLSAMQLAASVTPTKGVRPTLKNALVSVESDKRVTVMATDMEVSVRMTVEADEVEGAQQACWPAKLLNDLLNASESDVVSLDTGENTLKAQIVLGRDVYSVVGLDTDDFPECDVFPEGECVTLRASDFGALLKRTQKQMASEQGRYALNGLFVGMRGNELHVVSTDGRRLSVAKYQFKDSYAETILDKDGSNQGGVILPHGLVKLLDKLCHDADPADVIDFGIHGRRFFAHIGNVTVSGQIVEGIFPKYIDVIPKDMTASATFKREYVMSQIKKAERFTSDETHCVQFTFDNNLLTLTAQAADVGTAKVLADVEFTQPAAAVGLNPKYVLDYLSVLDTDTVVLELKDGSRPVIVRESKDAFCVIMPVNPK